jgi:NADP-dependent 3-hydroxy acid dehydrogenase YdfG
MGLTTAAVTGGARGIGLATARALHRAGMSVAIGDLDADLARTAAAEFGGGAVGLELDVTRRESFTDFLDATEETFGELDVLVNNAGIMVLGPFADEDDDTARRMVDINVHGVLLGTKLALARMQPRDRGHIVNLASQAGRVPTPGGATYAATKHAVVAVSEAVRGELRHEGSHVRVSYVLPYLVDTELGRGTLTDARSFKLLKPEQVADAIVDALRDGTVDVWLPRRANILWRLATVAPRRVAEAVQRGLRADRVLADYDDVARRAYNDRAARSVPDRAVGFADGRQRVPERHAATGGQIDP